MSTRAAKLRRASRQAEEPPSAHSALGGLPPITRLTTSLEITARLEVEHQLRRQGPRDADEHAILCSLLLVVEDRITVIDLSG